MNAIFYPQSGVQAQLTGKLTELSLRSIEKLLGGPLEVVQLDERTCLLTNANARELSLPKNRDASELWFEKHPVSGHGADFILGPVIHCQTSELAHLNHLHAEPKPVLTPTQRAERNRQYQSVALAPVCEMADGCLSCGS